MVKVLEMFGEPITYGGQESVVFNMLSSFDLENDFHVDLYTPYYVDNNNLINLINEHNGKIYTSNVEFKTNDNRFLLSNFVDNFFDGNSDYDVVHIHTGSLSTMLLYSICAKNHDIKKVIAHIHIASSNQNLFSTIRKHIICHELLKFVDVYLGCSKLAIRSRFTKSIYEKAKVVYNGIDINKFKFNDEIRQEYRKKYNIDSKFIIGSLGRLSYQKNLFFIIDLIKQLSSIENDIVLFVVGTGELEDKLKKYAYDLGLKDKVIFAGNQKEAYKFYNIFDCFILPSFFEGLPVTAIEAQVSGLYTLISNNVTDECIISPYTKILDVSDIKKWVNQIMQIKNKISNIKYRYNANIDFNRFDRKHTYKIVSDVYKGII